MATLRRLGIPKSTGLTSHGTLAPVGDEKFSHYLRNELHSGSIVKPHVPADSRGYNKQVRLPSASSQRAKRGFVYWCKEPKPKTHGNNNVPTCSTNLHTHVVTFQVRKLHLDLTKQLLDLVMPLECSSDNCIHSCYQHLVYNVLRCVIV